MSASLSSYRCAFNRAELEDALRYTTARIRDSVLANGRREDLSVKRVRARVERELCLPEHFFQQASWYARSKAIIEKEALNYTQSELIPSVETPEPIDTNSSVSSERSESLDEAHTSQRDAQTQTGKAQASKRGAGPTMLVATDPDIEKIQKLQRQLGECGVQKVWKKELMPFKTPLEKIKHLRKMLVDVGIIDQFSKEKAASIRKERELAAEREAVQEGNRLYGTDADVTQRPIRRPVRSMPIVDLIEGMVD